MARRVRGMGSVRYHDGRWQARIQLAPGRRPTASFDSEQEGWDWVAKTRAEAAGVVVTAPQPARPPAPPAARPGMRFEDMVMLYKASRIPRWKDGKDGGSAREFDSAAGPVIKAFGPTPIGQIAHGDLATWLATQIGRPVLERYGDNAGKPSGRLLSPTTVNKHLRVLKAVFKHAVRMGWLAADPAAGLERDKSKRPKVRSRTLRLWEVQALLSRAKPRHRLLLTFLVLTGLRRGELARAAWSWLHLDEGAPCPHCITLPAPIAEPHMHVMKPKVDVADPRVLPLAPQLVELLAAVPEHKRAEHVFPGRWNPDGTRRLITTKRRAITSACKAAGVDPKSVSHHSFRYAAASILEVDLLAPRGVVRAFERHEAGEVTDLYVEATQDQLREWVAKLADTVFGPPVAVPMRRSA